jgi:hypothetical protein
MEMTLAKKANQIEYEIIQSRGKKLFDQHGLETGKVIRAMAVSRAKQALAKEQPTEEQPSAEQPEEMKEDKLREMVRAALSKPLNEDDWQQKDDESDMAKSQLLNLIDTAKDLEAMISDGEQLDAWVQAKLTTAQDYIESVYRYMKGEDLQSVEEPQPSIHEKKLTTAEKNKEEDIVKAIAKQKGGKDKLTGQDYAIATAKAKKLAEIIMQRLKESKGEYAKIEKEIADLKSKGKNAGDKEMQKLIKRRAELEKSKK